MTDNPIKTAHAIIDQFQRESRNKRQDQNGRYIIRQEDIASVCAQLQGLFPNGAEHPNDLIWKFEGYYFPEPFMLPPGHYSTVTFANCKFETGVRFADVTFAGALAFSHCDLSKREDEDMANVATLERVTVTGATVLDGSRFNIIACTNTEFNGNIDISGTEINALNGGVFKKPVKLSDNSRIQKISGAKFYDKVRFLFGNLSRPIAISKCHFGGPVAFGKEGTGQSIHGLALQVCEFDDDVVFVGLSHHKEMTIEHVKFSKQCEFRACKFTTRSNFFNVTFEAPPFFTGEYSLSPDTHFQRCRFRSTKTQYDLTAYRELRHIAHETIRSAVDEGRFFALEQRTLARLEWQDPSRWGHATISTLYWLGSNYGESIMRPLLGFGIVTVGAWLALCFYSEVPHVGEYGVFLADKPVLGLTLQNIFSPFTFFSRAAAFAPTDVTGLAASVAQSVLSLLLFALFALSVRRRLRKGSE